MAERTIRVCPCRVRGCHGWLRARHHIITMCCTCDTCNAVFVVCEGLGETFACDPWDRAVPALRRAAVRGEEEIDEWDKRFAELKKGRHLGDIVAVDTRQKRADALTRADATHKRLLPKSPQPKLADARVGTGQASKKAQIIPHGRIAEERAKSIDEMLDATAAKKTKKGP